MLKPVHPDSFRHFIGDMIAIMNGNSPDTKTIEPGLYQIGSFGSSLTLADTHEQYPDLPYDCPVYGVCDTPDQIFVKFPFLKEDPQRGFTITVTPVDRDAQSPEGGWRWCKWGEYIGDKNPQSEYLYDEPDIERVYCFHIYEEINQC